MLDQNTDRMWFVIGALVVGAGIILLANKMLPNMFSEVVHAFENPLEAFNSSEDDDLRKITWMKTINDFSKIYDTSGATLTKIPNQTVSGFSNSGTRIQSVGGTKALKGVLDLIFNQDQVQGREYVYTMDVKNNSSEQVTIRNNKGKVSRVGAGETRTIRLVGHGDNVSHLQMQLLTARNDIDLDVTVSNLKLGYYN